MLYFRNVSLYQTVSIDIYLENKSLLSCNVSVIVDDEELYIQPPSLHIKSYLTEIVTLTYSPQHLGVSSPYLFNAKSILIVDSKIYRFGLIVESFENLFRIVDE